MAKKLNCSLKKGKRSEQTFLQKRYTNGNKHRKRLLTLPIIKEVQTQTTMNHHFIPTAVVV